jgi:hypothetical protein
MREDSADMKKAEGCCIERAMQSVYVKFWMWEHRTSMKEAKGCCIASAIQSDYIHNQMSKQVTNEVT